MRRIALLLFILTDCNNDENTIERWNGGQIKIRKIHYNEKEPLQFFLEHYSSDGQLTERTNYNNQRKDGWSITYYENEKVKDSIFYRNNKKVLQARGFHKNKKLRWVGEYDEENGEKDGTWRFFDSLGRIHYVIEYINGVEAGPSRYFDETGSIIKEISRYRDGELKQELVFKDSMLHGTCKQFFASGELSILSEYRNGVLHGAYKEYFESGQPSLAGEYKDGKRMGTFWIRFHDNGNKSLEYYYEGETDWEVKILNIWEACGNPVVTNGNGKHIFFEYCKNKLKRRKNITRYLNGKVVSKKRITLNRCY